jgi:hypothetical protein
VIAHCTFATSAARLQAPERGNALLEKTATDVVELQCFDINYASIP